MVMVSVVVVAKNASKTIERCVTSICSQEGVSQADVEVILVDDGSTDATVQLARKACSEIRVIENAVSSISKNRNIGWKNARGKYIAYIDSDCVASRCWLMNLLDAIEGSDYAAVGGGNRPPAKLNYFYDALGVMLNCFLGSRGSVQGMIYEEMKAVDHLPALNLLVKKCWLERVGGFDEAFSLVGEDEDLCRRLRYIGGRLLYVPDSEVIHFQRNNFPAWAKNMVAYGKGRSWLISRHPQSFELLLLMPIISLMLFPFYLPCITLYAFILCSSRKKLWLFPGVLSLFVVTHMSYAVGMIAGLIVKGDSDRARERKISRKKCFLVLKNAGNKGDEAIFHSFVSNIKDKLPVEEHDNLYIVGLGKSGVDIRLIPNNDKDVELVAGGVMRPTSSSRDFLPSSFLKDVGRLVLFMLSKPRVIISGGQWFHDLSLINYFVLTGFFIGVRICGGRTGVFSVGVGPLRSKMTIYLLGLCFSKDSFVSARDEASSKLFEDAHVVVNSVTTDPVIGFMSSCKLDSPGDRKKVGISPCAWTSFDNIYKKKKESLEKTRKEIEKVVSHFLNMGWEVCLVPTMNPEDYDFSKEIEKKFFGKDISLIDVMSCSAVDVQEVIGGLDLLISMRLHPLIFAMNKGVCFLAVIYAEKVRQLGKQFNCLERMVEVDSEGWGGRLIDLAEKAVDQSEALNVSSKIYDYKKILNNDFYNVAKWLAG